MKLFSYPYLCKTHIMMSCISVIFIFKVTTAASGLAQIDFYPRDFFFYCAKAPLHLCCFSPPCGYNGIISYIKGHPKVFVRATLN